MRAHVRASVRVCVCVCCVCLCCVCVCVCVCVLCFRVCCVLLLGRAGGISPCCGVCGVLYRYLGVMWWGMCVCMLRLGCVCVLCVCVFVCCVVLYLCCVCCVVFACVICSTWDLEEAGWVGPLLFVCVVL